MGFFILKQGEKVKDRIRRKLKQNKAFTLAELLITVAIITVLLGLSMLFISDWVVHLKMMELDGYAKSIYLEMQNQLAAKEVEGGLVELYDEVQTNTPDRFLTTQPQDYDVNEDGDNWKLLCYIQKDDASTKSLIAENSSTYAVSGNYLIELNPRSGDIYGVFYWEKEDAIGYDLIKSLTGRTIDDREDLRIGYYGGNAETRALSRGITLEQTVEVINEEELYLKVKYKKSGVILANQDALSIDLSIADEHGHVWHKDDVEATKKQEADGLAFYILLDSLQSGKSFYNITEGALVPGDNLSITVEGEFLKYFYHCIEISEVKANSLFNDKSGSTIKVGALRHFRNLNKTYYEHKDVTPGETVQIIQSNDIDFENNTFAWTGTEYKGKGNGNRPFTNDFEPVINSTLFKNTGVGTDYTVYDGNGFALKNFVITPSAETESRVGMFAEAYHVHFVNVKIEDLTLNASTAVRNVGGLVGAIDGGRVINCGVYLRNYEGDATDKKYCVNQVANNSKDYANRMQEKVATMTVSGGNNVGGLIGRARSVLIKTSFSAVNVVGTQYTGGLIGLAEVEDDDTVKVSVDHCYASGTVTANKDVGGLIGKAISIDKVNDSYASGDVFGEKRVGGFLGSSENGAYDTCYSYGRVLQKGENIAPENGTGGGFVYKEASNGNTYKECRYLKQKAYNAIGLSDPSGEGVEVWETGYSHFCAPEDKVIATGMTFAYDDALTYKSFPFVPVTGSHYGNWPLQNSLNNSLVYYEKYADGSYGYYSVTTLDDESNDYVWVLDTLKDETCVEDGYALLCMYNLTRFSYDLHIGSVDKSTQTRTLTVKTEYANKEADAKKQAIRLRQQGTLEFRGYKEQTETYDPNNCEDIISVTGMYLYQLPYELQCTNRTNVANFYDRLIVYGGYAKGNDGVGATPVLGGSTSAEGISYFYCPHFAKTAVNPGTDGADKETLLNPEKVYVRSARQLNALGRNSYYWNKKQGLADKLNFTQETDIDFSTYATVYCGHTFDLMNVDSEVANQPIGDPNIKDSPAQFQNNYNGQCNKIKNYCTKSSKQFVGLFGEILGARIENIVMVADEGKGSIVCEFDTYLGEEKDRAGVGALVGLAFKQDEVEDSQIINCVSAGYTVRFVNNNANIGRIGVGGLVGFSLTNIQYCAAVNNIRYEQGYDSEGAAVNTENAKAFIGGLAGSFLYGTLENAYAGGNIQIVENGNSAGFFNVAGVTPGGMRIPGYDYATEKGLVTITDVTDSDATKPVKPQTTTFRNLYSYTNLIIAKKNPDEHNVKRYTWNEWESWKLVEHKYEGNIDDFIVGSDFYVVSTAVGNLFKNAGGRYIDNDDSLFEAAVENGQTITIYGATLEHCYYLNNTIDPKVVIGSKKYLYMGEITKYTVNYNETYNVGTPQSFNELASLRTSGLKDSAEYTYLPSGELSSYKYPFPAVIKDEKGNYVHYGDWPPQ